MIEIGELVRTKTGYIGIVENINDFRPPEAKICVDFNVPDLIFLGETDIIKHSKNIIDLIEVGDYVNGFYVERVWEQINNKKAIDLRGDFLGLNDDEYIETVVTKELFEANCYKVKEE